MITVLTATYNRAATLPRLFESLCAQTSLAFEWLIVDDGSVDQTNELLRGYSSSAPFKIKVIQQLNSGKHVALNNGAAQADTPWLFIVDSDDALVATAIETILDAIPNADYKKAAGLCYRKAYFDMRLIGLEKRDVTYPLLMTPTSAGHFFKGDLAYIFRTALLKKYKFPVFSNEKFVPELFIWNKIGDEGGVIFFGSDILYLCDYLEDGYSKNFFSNLKRNPNGFFVFYWSQISREESYIYKAKYFIRAAQCYLYILRNRFL
ncbi:glycosyltransferase family 2 protein [Pseudomonas umsongensis]|uniref:glycosyltransferase family 2 protein n=1 Tax=Pseudomonas umsongensis TaxID=198618 RepID=UPI003ED09DEC